MGKPIGIAGFKWLVTRLSRGRVRPPVGWASVIGGGAIAGIGFTVSLLIARLAFSGIELEEAKLGVLSAALYASALTWVVLVIRELLADFGDLRYVWRHLPLNDVHPHAQFAAEAAEAAGAQGNFWEMYDLLFAHQGELLMRDLVGYANQLALDSQRFREDLRKRRFSSRVAEDVESADLSGVSGTPMFFTNGRRHYSAYDINTLTAAVRAARVRAAVARPSRSTVSGSRARAPVSG